MGLALIRGDDIARRRQAAIDKSRQSGRGSRRHQGPSGRRHLAGALRREQLDTAPLSYYAIMVIVAVLVLLGLVMLLSASAAKNVGGDASPYSMVLRQVMWTAVGVFGMAVAMRVPYRSIRPLAVPGSILGFALRLHFIPTIFNFLSLCLLSLRDSPGNPPCQIRFQNRRRVLRYRRELQQAFNCTIRPCKCIKSAQFLVVHWTE